MLLILSDRFIYTLQKVSGNDTIEDYSGIIANPQVENLTHFGGYYGKTYDAVTLSSDEWKCRGGDPVLREAPEGASCFSENL